MGQTDGRTDGETAVSLNVPCFGAGGIMTTMYVAVLSDQLACMYQKW